MRSVPRAFTLGLLLVTAAACAPPVPGGTGATPAQATSTQAMPAEASPGSAAPAAGQARLGPAPTPTGTAGARRPAPARADTAAARYGWTKVVARDDFGGSSLHPAWGAYDSAGNAGKGRRSPRQINVGDGVLTMRGTADGTTAGMGWDHPRKYGRWEARARFPAGCTCYHPVLILWPVDHPWPAGGEIDYAEILDGERRGLNFFLHYSAENKQLFGSRRVDMTRWHAFAVEWTPDHISGYVDGERFFHTTRRDVFPPGRMEQTIQLDWFPDGSGGTATLQVDWIALYDL